MADVTLDPQSTNSKELYGQGIRAYVLQDYDGAVKAFSTASELLSSEHSDELHDSLGNVYLYYGKSLLELSRKEGGPFGEGVPQNADESESENEDVEGEEVVDGETAVEENGEVHDEVPPLPPAEEELTDLQVAWEVLELAKKIFTRRGDDGRKNLAETLIVLGEIALEGGNYPTAIEDMKCGLEIQQALFGSDSRTIAETLYKLGGAYATNGQIDDAIEHFNKSLGYLKTRVTNLEINEADNADEIAEIKELLPEVEEKVADMKSFKEEIAKKLALQKSDVAASNGAPESSSSASSTTSSTKQATDISHLVKRKRKSDDETPTGVAKKPSP